MRKRQSKLENSIPLEYRFLKDLAEGMVPEEVRKLDFRTFVDEAWNVVEPSTPFIPNWHIDAICDHLQAVANGDIRFLMINVPPRHCKSRLTSVFWPAWVWTFDPAIRWLFASYSSDLSTEHSMDCRRIIRSEWYQNNWSKVFQISPDQDRKTMFENNKRGYRIATSVSGTATGRGGDIIVVDDPHNVKEAPSKAVRSAVITWWTQVMSSRLNDPKTGRRVLIMQRCHEMDLAGHILKEELGWDWLCLPTEFNKKRMVTTSIKWNDPRKAENELLWPARYGVEEIARAKKDLGIYGYASQHQQTPHPPEGGIIKTSWWKFYKDVPLTARGELGFEELIQSWDLAFKDTDASSYVVGQVWGRTGSDKYLLDQVRGRFSFIESIHQIRKMSATWPKAIAKLIEDKANGPAVIDILSKELSGIIPVNPQGGKLARLNAVSPQVEAGNIHLPENDEWVQDFLDEFAAATPEGGGQFWDQIDATTQALMRLSRPSRQLTFGRRPMNNVVPLDGSRAVQLTFGRKERKSVRVFGGRGRRSA